MTWSFAKRLLSILIPLITALALVLRWLYRSDVNALQTETHANEWQVTQRATRVIVSELNSLRLDLRFLAELTHWAMPLVTPCCSRSPEDCKVVSDRTTRLPGTVEMNSRFSWTIWPAPKCDCRAT